MKMHSLASQQQATWGRTRPSATAARCSSTARRAVVAAASAEEPRPEDAKASSISAPRPQLITRLAQEPNKLKRRGLMMAGAAAMFGCACCSDALGTAPAKAEGWSYGEVESWPGLCLTGNQQSPINVRLADNKVVPGRGTRQFPVGPLNFNYGRYERTTILNTGHGTMQVNFQPGNTVAVPKRYVPTSSPAYLAGETGGMCMCPTKPFDLDLLQFHFHTPSEHAMDGKQHAMEVHLVHRNRATGGLAVVGVLIQPGGVSPNPCLEMAMEHVPSDTGVVKPVPKAMNPACLLPRAASNGMQSYVHYTGSLTTPPCTEGVDWFVMTTPIKVTDKQVLDFMAFAGGGNVFGRNSRPVQSLGNRKLEYSLVEV